jgi:hypothetical protein
MFSGIDTFSIAPSSNYLSFTDNYCTNRDIILLSRKAGLGEGFFHKIIVQFQYRITCPYLNIATAAILAGKTATEKRIYFSLKMLNMLFKLLPLVPVNPVL